MPLQSTWQRADCALGAVRISCLRTGGGKPPVVLLHGLMGSGACWAPVARVLEAQLDVVMPDARGHGCSGAPDTGYRYDDLADDVVDLIDVLRLERPLLVGHSMGGMTAALAATRMGDALAGLVLVDPTFLSPERQREVYDSGVAADHDRAVRRGRAALVEDALARHPGRPTELLEAQVDARLATSPEAFDILRPPNPPYRDLVAALEVPTLLVIGDKPVVIPEVATELCSLNPRVRLVQVAAAGHGLPFDQPQRLAESIVRFAADLRRIGADG